MPHFLFRKWGLVGAAWAVDFLFWQLLVFQSVFWFNDSPDGWHNGFVRLFLAFSTAHFWVAFFAYRYFQPDLERLPAFLLAVLLAVPIAALIIFLLFAFLRVF